MLPLLLLLLAAPQAVQQAPPRPVFNGRAHQLVVTPPVRDASATIDGVLSEPVWREAALLTGFSQYMPRDDTPAADSTELLVWYSRTAIHFGVRAFQPRALVRATLADRDKIDQDDYVQLLLDTFNDGRQATVFSVNPFGVQADGILRESGNLPGGGFSSGTTQAREVPDLNPDFVFESKGRLTDFGYEVEIRIPFKSMRFQAVGVQTWGINVVRKVQYRGYEDSWAPAQRAAASFLGQSGKLSGLTDLRRGVVVDVTPE
ncbi:MAG: carbohydrate binding family 9 domain-containing protein, partial [Gemmatimonadetes bacterium]|nr:carbohydrate binding family 9 domain-containing protein [Gemmatimonadota bacterium]